jgi:2-haloacid dehalogenase
VILSYEHGLMKPHLSLYRIAAEKTGEDAASILFLDDRADNVAAAVASGWRAHQFTDAGSAREVLRVAGVLG